MGFGGLGMWEILLIMLMLLLVFGAKRLPELGSSLGRGIREFKRSVKDIETELKNPVEEPRRELQDPPRTDTVSRDTPASKDEVR